MSRASTTHLVIIPSYNSGPLLVETVREALRHWSPVWVVVDASTDGSDQALSVLAETCPGLRVIMRARNGGKGEAVLTAADAALREGFTHALVMDADGQHPAESIGEFMAASREHPSALILGRPVFGPEAPLVRLQGRKLSVGLVRLEIFGQGIDDPLFGFRVYPLIPLVRLMHGIRGGRRYDFDPEMAVRLVWAGVPTENRSAACRYRSREDGGISHFHYVRDNARMVWLHTRLLVQLLLWRWPHVLRARRARRKAGRGAARAPKFSVTQ